MDLVEKNTLIFNEIKHDNEATFKKVYEDYYVRLCFFADKMIHDFDKSRSIVQETFVELWIKRKKITINHSIKTYLFNSVRNASIDYLRKEKSNSEALEKYQQKESEEFHDLVEEAELNDRINKAIAALPEKCHEIFILCRFDNMKYSQIADKLHISVKTVEMQMGIALKKLRKTLSDYQWINLFIFINSKK